MGELGGGWRGDIPRIPGHVPHIPDAGQSERPSVQVEDLLRKQLERAKEAERARQAEQAERARQAEQAERARQAEQAERARQAEQAERARQAEQAERGEKHPEPGVAASADKPSDLAPQEAAAFVKDSLLAFAESFAQGFADVHGIGLALRVAKWSYGVSKWARVADGDGGVDVQAPLPVGPDVVLGVSAHLGGDPESPPLTFCIAPSGEWGVGAVCLGELELAPETRHAPADQTRLP